MTVNRSAKNSARCQRSIAILSLRTEHDGISSNLKFHDWCDLETTLHDGKPYTKYTKAKFWISLLEIFIKSFRTVSNK